MAAHLAKAVGAQALLTDFHLASQFRFPTQIEDAVATLKWRLGRDIEAPVSGHDRGLPARRPKHRTLEPGLLVASATSNAGLVDGVGADLGLVQSPLERGDQVRGDRLAEYEQEARGRRHKVPDAAHLLVFGIAGVYRRVLCRNQEILDLQENIISFIDTSNLRTKGDKCSDTDREVARFLESAIATSTAQIRGETSQTRSGSAVGGAAWAMSPADRQMP
ncbi:hypothetical protein AYO21_09125 [Fonsecaea monophora]|uniref:Uncharacterized protein n=1 Tax=Fonsecaea monophora TaxID=254056 RepID=A0A177EZH3_9EURO|nr:hypothetical protein AYO21_09125 [Fonsecaea monophora]OAG36650.1 hypothetical protein AYO21_09125 [Fonsecaea monophora]